MSSKAGAAAAGADPETWAGASRVKAGAEVSRVKAGAEVSRVKAGASRVRAGPPAGAGGAITGDGASILAAG